VLLSWLLFSLLFFSNRLSLTLSAIHYSTVLLLFLLLDIFFVYHQLSLLCF
jgi:hypothetical protein